MKNKNCPICITGEEIYLIYLENNVEFYYFYCNSCKSETTNYLLSKINNFSINGYNKAEIVDIKKIKNPK